MKQFHLDSAFRSLVLRRTFVIVVFLQFGWPRLTLAGAFEETGSLSHPRYLHTATLLQSGEVLVAGGSDVSDVLSSSELYDPINGTWAPTGNLSNRRAIHAATLLSDGKVLIAGGTDGPASLTASCELYDPASGVWTPTGSLSMARSAFTATLLPDGKVLAAGPGTGVELYDPTSGSWADTGSLATGRQSHTANLLANGMVLVTGGQSFFTGKLETFASAELYDPATGTWSSTGSLSTARYSHTATLLSNGMVLVTGGQSGNTGELVTFASAELYDPATGTWASTSSLSTARYSHTATLLTDGKVLVVGGFGIDNRELTSAEVYDPESGTWSFAGSLNTGRFWHTATLLPSGKALIAGGANSPPNQSFVTLASAELYDPVPLPKHDLENISTRLSVGTGDNVLIGGFIVTGTTPKTVLLRAIGPSLTDAGLSDVLADPILELHEPDGTVVTNDNWRDTQASEITATNLQPSNDLESAILVTLDPADPAVPGSGAYTAIVRGNDGGTGLGLVEAYGLEGSTDSRLANISTRGFVQTGDDVIIGGLIIGGTTSQILVRAIGPELTVQGVAGALEDTTLELHDKDGMLITENDDWKETQQTAIEATGLAPSDDRESAILATLAPDSYTAIVRGRNDTTGVALVEVYNIGQ